MAITISFLIKKYLGKLQSFSLTNELQKAVFEKFKQFEDEEFCGIYKNPKPYEFAELLMSNKGIHVLESDVQKEFILYEKIVKVDSLQDKSEANELSLILNNNKVTKLFIAGTFEETKDLYMFYTFLLRVVGRKKDDF